MKMRTSSAMGLVLVSVFVLAGTVAIWLVNIQERRNALEEAELKARIILNNNLAIHSYFNESLKPAIFQLEEWSNAAEKFDARWMSSTYAVREIHKKFVRLMENPGFYYKECAINARSPENEADGFEKMFIEELNRDSKIGRRSLIRRFDGKPYLVVVLRGEVMEVSCLRCHSVPGRAPKGLVDIYGPARSFGRPAGEVVSAVSIRIPLSYAFASTNRNSLMLSGIFLGILFLSFLSLFLFNRRFIFSPLELLGDKVRQIATDPQFLGELVPEPAGREMAKVARSFNEMSASLRENRDLLEERIAARTAELAGANEALIDDIEKRVQAEEALERTILKWDTLFSNMLQGFALHRIVTDDDGTPVDYVFLEVNEAFEKMTGLVGESILDKKITEVMPDLKDSTFGWIERYGKVAQTGESLVSEVYAEPIEKWFRVSAYCPEKGTFAVMIDDITGMKLAEEQLRHSQKMESLGLLAGGIAHDFNNLLMGIMGNVSLAQAKLPPDSVCLQYMKKVETAGMRAAELTNQMLAYSGKGKFVLSAIDMNHLIEEMVSLLQSVIQKNVVLELHLDRTTPTITGDTSQIRQVVMNLITNASDAVGETSGVVTVSTGSRFCDRAYLAQLYKSANLAEGRYVFIEVSDTGHGMDQATIKRIFDPFFTTKKMGRGLGLSAVIGIVGGHKGTIKVYSKPGKGTTFKVLLPASGETTERATDEIEDQTGFRGTGTVLVVDDEETVRDVASGILENIGFNVVTAKDGEEAVNLFRERSEEIVFVLMDLTMPRMDGRTAFKEMRRIRKDIRVILSSGYDEKNTLRSLAGKGLAEFIRKPYGVQDLIAKVRKVLGE